LLREHLRARRGAHRMPAEDRPKHTSPAIQQLLWRAETAGAQIGALCQQMHRRSGPAAVRRVQGVLSLTKKYGLAAVEQACATALEVGFADYRLVRRYLERTPSLAMTLRQVDPLIRQLTIYRDLIENQTKEQQA
jgi:hypothetical protein